ncbi:DUF1385 domain-containing protein, partial [Candidatus Peregrinibacteria bacterium]|nr:DUF1385 domain-containing protein [Candidatus Peregrinibacteria bacterium]
LTNEPRSEANNLAPPVVRRSELTNKELVRRGGSDEVDTARRVFQRFPKIDFAVGGQAVIEGVMMRSPGHITTAVRKTDGTIKVDKKKYEPLIKRYNFLNIPIVRGIINLFEMMVIGTKAINFSANEFMASNPEDCIPSNVSEHSERTPKNTEGVLASSVSEHSERTPITKKLFEYFMFALSLIFALAFSILLFKFIPLWITTYIDSHVTYVHENYFIFNLIDGLLKALVFLAYIYILTLLPSFKRIFEYHGAEHKSIFTYENNLALEVENAKKQIRFHPRCGTSFILIVFMISILAYMFLPKQDSFAQNLGLRILALPVIAGISYELLRLTAKHMQSVFFKPFILPGLAFQRLTTKEPDDSQLEVGLSSLKEALVLEGRRPEGLP